MGNETLAAEMPKSETPIVTYQRQALDDAYELMMLTQLLKARYPRLIEFVANESERLMAAATVAVFGPEWSTQKEVDLPKLRADLDFANGLNDAMSRDLLFIAAHRRFQIRLTTWLRGLGYVTWQEADRTDRVFDRNLEDTKTYLKNVERKLIESARLQANIRSETRAATSEAAGPENSESPNVFEPEEETT